MVRLKTNNDYYHEIRYEIILYISVDYAYEILVEQEQLYHS